MPVSTILHKGKKIVYIDYSNAITEDQTMKTLYEARDYIQSSPVKVRKLNNVEGAFASLRFMNEAKRLNKEILDHKTEKGAIIGLSSVQEILLKSFNLLSREKLIHFKTKQEALEYLAQ